MRKITMLFAAALLAASASAQEQVITKEDGMTVVNTTTLAKDVDGYNGPTPLKIYIKKNKIVKVEALKSQEGPKYYAKVKKQLFPQWEGKTVKKAQAAELDGVTGATFTANAVKENVKRGLDYYQKHK
ncbi:MAG: FMN-binding protein [Bacteroidaceae bacterium]|nr:FMN-binding protein [Bacteroidaceae bacterium]